ncbi:SDR family oxidoreductase [Actinopolymorpha sp. B11F2]|uniref:SDR family oxidoreductase n=1 Tax=Actinopolymorpha sp. B11F2 TaxID=3160862 RepID=UPI0032E48A55
MVHKIALVTGAGTGVGRAITLALARDGWSVALAGRRPQPLHDLADELRAAGHEGLAVPADVADPGAVESLFAAIRTTYGRLDLLVNNAGRNAPAVPLEDLELTDWQGVVDVNLTGAFLCTQQAVRLMKSQTPRGGRIINNGSLSAHTPRPQSAPYTATKHAITGLTKATALDGRDHGIACGQIDIGNAETPMTARMADGVRQPDGSIRVEPTMDVNDVGRAVAYMASLPLDANVPFMTVMATGMPFLGRG